MAICVIEKSYAFKLFVMFVDNNFLCHSAFGQFVNARAMLAFQIPNANLWLRLAKHWNFSSLL